MTQELVELLASLSPAGLREVEAVARAVSARERGVPALASLSLEDFALRVQRACNASRRGWPHADSDKVFVAVVFDELEAEAAGLDCEQFKARLLQAQRAGLIGLSRCDLVKAAAPEDVARSEIRYLNAVWHLVRRT